MCDFRKSRELTSHRFVTWGTRQLILFLLIGSIASWNAFSQEPESSEAPIVEEGVATPTEEPTPAEVADPTPKAVDAGYGMDAIRGANAYLDKEAGLAGEEESGQNSPLLENGSSEIRNALFRMIGALAVVLALILFCFYALRRFGGKLPAIGGRQLGQVIGQVHLTRDATLHYVRTGGRVLIVSVTSSGVNLVAEFGESAFDQDFGDNEGPGGLNADQFVAALKEQSATYRSAPSNDGASINDAPDDDMAVLRSDIHRLQEYLQEETRDSKD